jgi:glycosyltransferase involved in cell wall biosynthesis
MISGAALVAQRLAVGMAARGHTVLVMAASDRRHAYTVSANGLKIARLRSLPNPMRVGQCFVLRPRTEIAAQMRAFHPDVIHLQELLNTAICGTRIARALDIPVALTIHQLPWFASLCAPALPGLRQGIETCLWAYGGWLMRQCHTTITPSYTIADFVCAHTGRRPEVISNGVDLGRFTPSPAFPGESETLRRKYGLHPELPVIIHVGRIDVDKQVNLVIRAAARAMRSVNAELLVVGDGRRRAAVIRLSEKLGIREQSHFPGFVPPRGDLPGLYRLASVFITASEIETQGLVLLEAAATGLPAVAVRAAAIPEAIEDGITGYLAAPGDVDAIADRLVWLLQNPIQARKMGQAGRAKMDYHSLESSFDTHEWLYRSLVM